MMGCLMTSVLFGSSSTTMTSMRTKNFTTYSAFLMLLVVSFSGLPCGSTLAPNFTAEIGNLTVAVGRDAVFHCAVKNLGGYRVGWVKADTKAIQAIHDHVITHNPRVSVTHVDNAIWNLHIRSIQEEDRGQYMCQINTDPMISKIGYLHVVVSPDFIPEETSGDVSVTEGMNVRLKCKARGRPRPTVYWRREDGLDIYYRNGSEKIKVQSVIGDMLWLPKVNRYDMGAYLCIAINGVPPSISKRTIVNINFTPTVRVPSQLVGAPLGTDVTLECSIEASPKSINYWLKEPNEMVLTNDKYNVQIISKSYYEMTMVVTIYRLSPRDTGTYKCVAKNSCGGVESSIRVYDIPGPTKRGKTAGGDSVDEEGYYYTNTADRGARPSLQVTMTPPRTTSESLYATLGTFGTVASYAAIVVVTAAAMILPFLAVLFTI